MRRTPVLLSLLAAGAVTLTGCGGDTTASAGASSAPASTSSVPTSPATPGAGSSTQNVVGEVTLAGGKPQGGVQRIATKAGAPAVLVVTSDTAIEIHVHGVDRTVAVPANAPTPVDVSQPAPGSYEVEDHGSDALLVQLRAS